MLPMRLLFLVPLLLLLRCSTAVHSLRENTAVNIPEDFILVRISGTDCINCYAAYHNIVTIIADEHLDANTVFLAGNLPSNQQEEFFSEVLGDHASGKIILNNDTLFRQLGNSLGSSVSIYHKNKRVYDASFLHYSDAVFRQQLHRAFDLGKNRRRLSQH